MAERYSKLFSLPENQYAADAPVLIAAGALLKDNQTGKALAQIKFKSISEKQIKAVKVSVAAFDVAGKELEGVTEYQYLDLNVERNAEFGQKQAITLPDAVARSFKVNCTDVFFADGSAWNAAPDASWKTLPTQMTVADKLGSLAAQYQRDTSTKSKFVPVEHEDLWFCSCGALNHSDEEKCHSCKQAKADLFAALNLETLDQRNEEYKAAEAEKAVKQAEADKIQSAKTKKFAIIAAAVIAVVVTVSLLVTNVIIPNNQYKDAVALMEAGKYKEAIAIFESLEGRKDSKDKIDECKYNNALMLIESGKLAEAYDALMALNGYKDSAEKAQTVFDDYKIEQLKQAKVGRHVFLGTYEQDAVIANGKENIEWIVLDKKGDKLLVISKYVLVRREFDTEYWSVWEECTLRNWLNDEFLNEAFNDKEKGWISPNKDISTNDKVFLLSSQEVAYYLSTRRCMPTAAARRRDDENDYCWWWTRTEGSGGCTITVWDDGTIWTHGTRCNGDSGVRPAMWIDLSAVK